MFEGEHRFLSNFYPSEIVWEGAPYPTAEHLYQAMKADTKAGREWVRSAPTAAAAKSRGRQVRISSGWRGRRIDAMRSVLRAKFAQNPELARRLDATGEAELLEGNTWGDNFWGCDLEGRGRNHLGKLLMELRASLRG